jgi:AcrR family transcriptional regulator
MSRPKSSAKRTAILEASVEVFAERGYAHTPTSAISKAAGVAEGTLFTYFDSKDELINELYRALRKEFDRELGDYPFDGDVRTRVRFIWDRLLSLAKVKPQRLRVIKQLRASGRLYKDADAPTLTLSELLRSTNEAAEGERLKAVSPELLVILFRAQAEATVDYIAAHPGEESKASEAGFFLFWRGLTGQ